MHFLILGTDNIEGGGGGGAEVICGAFRQVTLLPYDFKLSFVPLFQYVYVQGGNPGIDFDFKRVVQPSDTPPENKFEWVTYTWSACSTTCGQGTNS